MKKLGFILSLTLALLLAASLSYGAKPPQPPPTIIFYYGYAVLYDTDGNNPYMIVSDGRGQYVDMNLKPGRNKHGDKIEVQLKYNSTTNGYDLIYFRCFIGKPELQWRSDRRARFNFDINNATKVYDVSNKTVADMLAYNNVSFPTVRRPLNDDSVHIAFQKGWYSDSYSNPDENWTAVLVDKTDVATDSNAITQTNLWTLDSDAPRYWTSLEGSSFGSEQDAHDHIAYFMYVSKLNYTPIGWETQGTVRVPVTWQVTPMAGPDEISVRTFYPEQFTGNPFPNDVTPYAPMEEIPNVLYTFPNGLSFKLIVSKYPVSLAPPKQRILTGTWGEIKGE